MRILLSEGSGLTSRQVARRLGEKGHQVELLSSKPLCLSRFMRHVQAVHRVPKFGADPFAWLATAQRIASNRKIDLLFPTQEQVAVLSAQERVLTVPTIVPPFSALRRVQDKISAFQTLREIAAPQPEAVVITQTADLDRVRTFPVFVKQSIGTASSGIRFAKTHQELTIAARELGLPLLVQEQVVGPLAMVQAVADRGRLVAYHAILRVKTGVGGGAALKESIALPALQAVLANIVSKLDWHGGLSLDVIVTSDGLSIIDVNPRLVEPENAYRSGVDLVGAMLDLIVDRGTQPYPIGKSGVLTHQTLLVALGAAEASETRRAIASRTIDAILSRGDFAGSLEELTPLTDGLSAFIPVSAALAAVLAHPPLWRLFPAGAVGTYALTAKSWDAIVASASR